MAQEPSPTPIGAGQDDAVQVDVATESGGQSQELRVTTWNILSPCIPAKQMFPFIKEEVYGQEHRRPIIHRRFRELGSDIFLLQEVNLAELRLLLQSGEPALQEAYAWHFAKECSDPQATMPDENTALESDIEKSDAKDIRGVAILWKKGLLSSVERLVEGTENAPNPACLVRGKLDCGDEVLFASKHLDATGCPPAVTRCQQELPQLGRAIEDVMKPGPGIVTIFGGDCNATTTPAVTAMKTVDYEVASGRGGPTCYAFMSAARFDHIFVRGQWETQSTEEPQCPKAHCCSSTPCMHQLQVCNDLIGISKPKVPGIGRRLLGCLICPFWFFGIICCLLLPIPLSVKRCRWALQEWGSDHVPVTVTLRRAVNGGNAGTPKKAV